MLIDGRACCLIANYVYLYLWLDFLCHQSLPQLLLRLLLFVFPAVFVFVV